MIGKGAAGERFFERLLRNCTGLAIDVLRSFQDRLNSNNKAGGCGV